jgi:REase_AHJR-like
MTIDTDFAAREHRFVTQYADWYSHEGYEVSVRPRPEDLPEFLRTLAPDLIARRNGENVVVEMKTSSPGSFEKVQRLAEALQHRAGWTLQVVYTDIPDFEWQPPARLPGVPGLMARLEEVRLPDGDDDEGRLRFLLLWSIIEAAARHRLSSHGVSPTARISSSALIKLLLSEGFVEDDEYGVLRQGLAVRNAIVHGFLNQLVDPKLFSELQRSARRLLRMRKAAPRATAPAVSP